MLDDLVGECEQLLVVRDRASRATAIVAVHDTRLGPAHGGIRRLPYGGIDEAARDVVALARAMTFKCALAELPAGGGKAVILDHPELDRAGAYRLVGRVVERLAGAFRTGPDVNTSAADLRLVGEETGYVATDAADGPGDLAVATASGVFFAIEALLAELGIAIGDAHCLVQGLGAVGMNLCELLARNGARMTVCDVVDSRCARAVERFGAQVVATEAVRTTPCDVLAPCALGGLLDEASADSLPVRGVCGAANNVLQGPAVAATLHARGVVVVPDFIANAGALIQGASWNLHGERVGPERLRRIGATVTDVLRRARQADRPPSELALALARERLERGLGSA